MSVPLTEAVYFEIPRPDVLPSTNKVKGLHWSKVNKMSEPLRESMELLAGSERHGRAIAPCGLERRKLRMCLVHGPGQHFLDRDNAYRALKPAVDALVAAKWLHDDSEKWLDYQLTQDKGEKGLIRVLIAPAETGDKIADHPEGGQP